MLYETCFAPRIYVFWLYRRLTYLIILRVFVLWKDLLSLEMDIQALSFAGAALAAGGLYINAKYGLSTDIREIRHEKNYIERLFKNYSQLGESCTIYSLFSRQNPTSDALWFEGRTWTYAQLSCGMCSCGLSLHSTLTDWI